MKVTTPNLADAKRCRVRITIDQVGNIWTLLVFHALANGSLRFMEIKRAIGTISQRSLTQALRDLERDGYLARKVYPTSPPKVEYRLTPLGQSLLKAMRSLLLWAGAHLDEVIESRKKYDEISSKESASPKPSQGAIGTTATVKDPNQTNRHTPHPGPLPVEGRGEPDDARRSSAIRRRIHCPAPANATAGARRTSLELDDASTAAPSPLNGERAGVRGVNNSLCAKCRCSVIYCQRRAIRSLNYFPANRRRRSG